MHMFSRCAIGTPCAIAKGMKTRQTKKSTWLAKVAQAKQTTTTDLKTEIVEKANKANQEDAAYWAARKIEQDKQGARR